MGWANYSSLVRTMTNLGMCRLPIKLQPEVSYRVKDRIELLGMTFAWIRMGSHEFEWACREGRRQGLPPESGEED